MSGKKIIAVVGATGAQGGGLVRAILGDKDSSFSVRALTRNVDSEKSKNLVKMGAEVVAADVNDVESVKRAFDGAYGAYCVTFYWEHFSPEKEWAHAKNLADAAQHAGVRHVIWSTLEDTRKWIPLGDPRMPTLMGKYKVPHFDAKGEANGLFTDRNLPTTFLLTSINPRRTRTGTWRSHFLWPIRSFPVSLPRISANVLTAFSRRSGNISVKLSVSPGNT